MSCFTGRTTIVRIACFALLLGAAAVAPATQAAAPDLFISEYVEGTSFNKSVEIYNATGATVDLSLYVLELYSNGSPTVSQSVALSGMLTDGDVFVISHGSADAAILAVTDQVSTLVINFNGNDGVVLRKAGVVVDAIGQIGVNPGASWPGSVATMDNTMRRLPGVCRGDTDAANPFTTDPEWAGFGVNVFTGLGSHTSDCRVPAVSELLLSELVVTPTSGEFIEIHNPTGGAIDLSNVYVTDATFSPGGVFYYNLPTGMNIGGGAFSDFYARFPDGATIGAGAYQTIALDAGFMADYGVAPTYEVCNSGAAPDMREALPGSIDCPGSGLSNGGEVVVLLEWDRVADLVVDLDYVVWGDKAEAVDKTGVTVGGSMFLADTPIASQDVLANGTPHLVGESTQRADMTEGTETQVGGNGAGGDDETSENLSVTWCIGAPTPNAATDCFVCGDGVLEAGEECDDGNNADEDGCDANCVIEFCGDGTLQAGLGEECDDGNNADGDGCQANCLLPVCGDGILDAGEQCDDGNTLDGDGCQGNCQDPLCGDGIVDAGEECDDGNNANGDGCQSNCLLPVCGDGILDPGEQCDDGNTTDADGCQGTCLLPTCGDGVVDAGEGCDDGNNFDHDGCSAACRPEGACCSNGPGVQTECFITNDVDCLTNHSLYLGDGSECTHDLDCNVLAATFDSLSATATPDGVMIRWVTSLETDTIGFRVLREVAGSREKAPGVVAELIPAAGHGLTGASYELLDADEAARFATHYFIEDIDIFGKVTRHGPIAIDRGVREQPQVRRAVTGR